jgi:sugar O-acyltransferase (sialic acid O-acetyltransferase NeuD family)
MTNLIMIGAGAHAAEIVDYILDANVKYNGNIKYNIKGFIEDEEGIEKYWRKYKLQQPVLGSMETYDHEKDDYFIIPMMNNSFRKERAEQAISKGWNLVNYIHPSVIISKSASIGIGNIICPNCIIGANACIGDFNILNCSATVSHDCTIGNFNVLSSYCGLAGYVKIRDNNLFSLHTAVIPNISIGSNNKVAPTMVVDRDVEDDSTIFYRFKEKVIAIPKAI